MGEESNMTPLLIVWAAKWNDNRDGYQIGIFSTLEKAKEACTNHLSDKLVWTDSDLKSYGRGKYHNYSVVAVEIDKLNK